MPSLNRRSHSIPGVKPASRFVMRAGVLLRRVRSAATIDVARLPRFPAIAIALLGSTAIYGVALGGHTTAVIDAFAEPLGLSIETVDVTGHAETSEIDVLQALWMTGAATLPSLDVDAAREAIEAMPWIDSASVTKIYPNRVAIELVEKQPFALWQRGRDLMIVDRDGQPIVPFATTRFTDLPFVVGTGAAENAADFVDRMFLIPELRDRVRAYIRVGERRWDLRLDNGVTVRLPEREPIEAAAEVLRMDGDVGRLSRDILSVDMRLEDRMVVKLTPEAKIRRDAALKAREKIVKQAEKEKPV